MSKYLKGNARPKLSIIVIVYSMVRQAMNTLHSLSESYQQGVSAEDYEIIVIENNSSATLDASEVTKMGPNFSYTLRDEKGVSPAAAINDGFSQCRAEFVGLMIDGARMVSPGVVKGALLARRLHDAPLMMVPSYDLGSSLQKFNVDSGYNADVEQELLASAHWQEDGYRLFNISMLGAANRAGYCNPVLECTCLFSLKRHWKEIGYADEGFNLHGGGALNLHLLRKLGLIDGTKFMVLAGEGAFHQFHGGTTTQQSEAIKEREQQFNDQLQTYWDGKFSYLSREPLMFGSIRPEVGYHFRKSCLRSLRRFKRFADEQKPLWPDTPDSERVLER